MIPAMEAHRALARRRTDEVVITTMTAMKEWNAVTNRQELDLPIVNGMGKASSVGLGLALARPDRRILVLDGDGSLLNNLGSLVTIAAQRPANLIHFVLENGQYETTGGQPIPAAGGVSFAALARAAGYAQAYEFDQLGDFEAMLDTILTQPGPTLVCLKVDAGGAHLPLGTRRTLQAVPEVMAALGTSPGAAAGG